MNKTINTTGTILVGFDKASANRKERGICRFALLAFAVLPFVASAATIYVDAAWQGQGGDGSAERPFGTLQEAASAVSSLDKISVADGTYPGDVDFGSMTLTNEVPSGTAKVTGIVKSSGAFRRTGEGVLMLNGITNSFSSLTLLKGTKTVVAPTEPGVTNTLLMTSDFGTDFGASDAFSFVVSNCDTQISKAGTIQIRGGRHVFVGGKLKVATTGSGTYFRPGYYTKSAAPKEYGGMELVLDNIAVTLNALTIVGNRPSYADIPGTIIITNDATITTGYNFWHNYGSIRQYSGKVKITGNGAPMLSISYNTNASASYYLHGGTLEQSYVASQNAVVIGGGATAGNTFDEQGYLYIYGGEAIFNAKNCFLGYRITGTKYHRGYLYVRGGKLSMPYNGAQLAVGRQGNGTFEVSNGGTATINGSVVALAESAGGRTASVSILTNGTLKARRIVSNANVNGTGDTATLILDGGKVEANTSASAEFMQGFTAASVGVGGVVVDTAGQNLTIAQSFAAREGQGAPSASTAAGLAALPAFTKAGAGTLSLTGDNEWLCATCVSNGTLVVGEDALPATTTLQLRGGVIDLGGNSLTVANLVGYGVVSNGTLAVTGAVWPGVYGPAALKIDSTATLSMTTLGCCVASDGSYGCLEVAGSMDLAGVTVVGEGMENKTHRGITLVRAAAFIGSPTADASLAGNGISFGCGTLRIGAPGFIIKFY